MNDWTYSWCFGSAVALFAASDSENSWLREPPTEYGPSDEEHPRGVRRTFVYLINAVSLLRGWHGFDVGDLPSDFDPIVGLGMISGFVASACSYAEGRSANDENLSGAIQSTVLE